MFSYLLRRLLILVPSFFGLTLLTFTLIRLIPGDPVEVMVGERNLDPAMHAAAIKRLGLDKPLPAQSSVSAACGRNSRRCFPPRWSWR